MRPGRTRAGRARAVREAGQAGRNLRQPYCAVSKEGPEPGLTQVTMLTGVHDVVGGGLALIYTLLHYQHCVGYDSCAHRPVVPFWATKAG